MYGGVGRWLRDIQPIVLTSEGSPVGEILCMAVHSTFEMQQKINNKRETKQLRKKRMFQSYKCERVPPRPDRFSFHIFLIPNSLFLYQNNANRWIVKMMAGSKRQDRVSSPSRVTCVKIPTNRFPWDLSCCCTNWRGRLSCEWTNTTDYKQRRQFC